MEMESSRRPCHQSLGPRLRLRINYSIMPVLTNGDLRPIFKFAIQPTCMLNTKPFTPARKEPLVRDDQKQADGSPCGEPRSSLALPSWAW